MLGEFGSELTNRLFSTALNIGEGYANQKLNLSQPTVQAFGPPAPSLSSYSVPAPVPAQSGGVDTTTLILIGGGVLLLFLVLK